PGQPQAAGDRTHGADGVTVIQLAGRLVRPRGLSLRTVSRSPVVYQENGTLLCRYAKYATAAQLGREINATAPQKGTAYQYRRPLDRLCQPCGLKRRQRRPEPHRVAKNRHRTALKSRAGRSQNAQNYCETRT